MATVSIKEARQRLAELVEAARRGASTTITRRGRKVAKITGVTEGTRPGFPDMSSFRASLKSGRTGKKTTIEDLRKLERA